MKAGAEASAFFLEGDFPMKIRCGNCGHFKKVSARLVVRVFRVLAVGFGFWAWVGYFFAGTGFALPICVALVGGGAAMLTFQNEIAAMAIGLCPRPNRGGGNRPD